VFTAVCILQLQEKGKLDISDTLDKYFPEYEAGKDITIYNLLHMNSGIPDYLNEPELFWGLEGEALDDRLRDLYHDKISDEELLKTLYAAPLMYPAGAVMTYSNTNYKLLAYIIEKVSGMKYCDYLEKYIFKPCGMKNSYAMRVDKYTYVPVDFKEQLEFGAVDEQGYSMSPNSERGDGGVCTCLTDFLAFDRALFNGKLLNEDSMKILLHNDKGYCCGLMRDSTGYSHTGGGFTASTYNTIINSEKYGHIYYISLEHC
jgi:CubicO group peptidase (beta-lactamase class C family)